MTVILDLQGSYLLDFLVYLGVSIANGTAALFLPASPGKRA
jgi:hypothetical protein